MTNIIAIVLLFYILAGFTLSSAASERDKVSIETLADLESPYGLAFLPNHDILVTEKPGRLRIIRNGKLLEKPVTGLPQASMYLAGAGQSYNGLLDIALHPQFAENGFIYLSLTQPANNAGLFEAIRGHWIQEKDTVRLIRGRYRDGHLSEVTELFKSDTTTRVTGGSRLAFLADNTLLMTIGEGYKSRLKAQDLGSALGKIIRLNDDGTIPKDNPFVGREGALPAIWSYGHRIAIGLLYDAQTDTVYEHENGPAGGDELNIINKGNNYGWPLATFGKAYAGTFSSPFTHYPGTEPPLVDWTPSLAPSGMAICRQCQWPEWEGNLFVGMLIGQQVRRVVLKEGKAIAQQALFTSLNKRVRDVRFGPDGAMYLLVQSPDWWANGQLLKVSAK